MGADYLQEYAAHLLRSGGLTGCQFVPRLLRDDRLVMSSFESVDVSALENFLRATGSDESVAMALFPSINDDDAFLAWLTALASQDSWRLGIRSREPFHIHLEWRTAEERWSSCMGFAPYFEMPIPRRLPCVALVLWPGHQTRSSGETVSFQDILTGLDSPTQKKLREVTTAKVGELFAIDPEVWREVSFGLPSRFRESPSFRQGA